jgi:hypothetical protein
MAFNGIHKAPEIEPTEFGLFAYAKPTLTDDSDTGNRWLRGFSQEYLTRPNYVRDWDETSSVSFVISSNPGVAIFERVEPIFIEVEDQRSTFDLPGEDRFERVTKQLEGCSQKALEYELWNGEIALAKSLPTLYLSKSTVTIIGAGAAFSPTRAMSLLEYYAGEMSPAGEHGVIHLTRDAFFLIATNSGVFIHSESKEHIQTATGTPCVIGSGYSGDGPHSNISTVAVTGGNLVTVVTATPHYLVTGESVDINAVVGAVDFAGVYTVTVVNSTTFTFAKTTSNFAATAPTGYATAQMQGSDTVKWIYATGAVHAYLGEIAVTNDNLAQGYDVSGNKNDMKIKAMRPAAAYFDPSIHLAVKINLTA